MFCEEHSFGKSYPSRPCPLDFLANHKYEVFVCIKLRDDCLCQMGQVLGVFEPVQTLPAFCPWHDKALRAIGPSAQPYKHRWYSSLAWYYGHAIYPWHDITLRALGPGPRAQPYKHRWYSSLAWYNPKYGHAIYLWHENLWKSFIKCKLREWKVYALEGQCAQVPRLPTKAT